MPVSALTSRLVRRIGAAEAARFLKILPEVSPSDVEHLYSMFNDGSVEIETAEFLYALVRLTKPMLVLETGTHKGISSLYMAEGCKDNERGTVVTLEWDQYYWQWAEKLHELAGHISGETVTVIRADTTTWDINTLYNLQPLVSPPLIDILFLDSEPNIRYVEFNRYFPFVRPGGFILIHDLHPNMSYSPGAPNPDHPELGEFWPFGDFRDSIGDQLDKDAIQAVHFHGMPRGFVMYYKVHPEDVDLAVVSGRLRIKT